MPVDYEDGGYRMAPQAVPTPIASVRLGISPM
jgi:hypothetical protein